MGELTPVSGASVCIISIQILALKSRSNEPQQHILACSVLFSVLNTEFASNVSETRPVALPYCRDDWTHQVKEIDGREIGDGEVGPVTKHLQGAYSKLAECEGEQIPFSQAW
jgi:hypothetical protein